VVVTSGVAQIATSKIFNALEMSMMITIVLNVTTLIIANTCGDIHVMQRIGEKTLTPRANVEMSTSASQIMKTLETALTIHIAPLLDFVQEESRDFMVLVVTGVLSAFQHHRL